MNERKYGVLWNATDRRKANTWSKTSPSATMCTTNHLYTTLGYTLGLLSDRLTPISMSKKKGKQHEPSSTL
jgi:hypothetical protein